MAPKYTELQQYRLDYIANRKKRIIERLEEIKSESEDPGILFEDHKKLMTEKASLIKEFDELTDEYREIIQAEQLYKYYVMKAYMLKKKWGLKSEGE